MKQAALHSVDDDAEDHLITFKYDMGLPDDIDDLLADAKRIAVPNTEAKQKTTPNAILQPERSIVPLSEDKNYVMEALLKDALPEEDKEAEEMLSYWMKDQNALLEQVKGALAKELDTDDMPPLESASREDAYESVMVEKTKLEIAEESKLLTHLTFSHYALSVTTVSAERRRQSRKRERRICQMDERSQLFGRGTTTAERACGTAPTGYQANISPSASSSISPGFAKEGHCSVSR